MPDTLTTAPLLGDTAVTLTSDTRLHLRCSHLLSSSTLLSHVATLYLSPELLSSAPHLLVGRLYWLHPSSRALQPVLVCLDVLLPCHLPHCRPLASLSSVVGAESPSCALCTVLRAQLTAALDGAITSVEVELSAVSSAFVAAQRVVLTQQSALLPASSSTPHAEAMNRLFPLFLDSSAISSSSLLACDHVDATQQLLFAVRDIEPPHPPFTIYRIERTTVISVLPPPPSPRAALPSAERWLDLVRKDMAGYDDALRSTIHAVHEALSPSSPLTRLYPPPHTFLLHGLAGTGKTRLADALSKHSALPRVDLATSDLFQKLDGEGEERLIAAFDQAKEAARSTGGAWVVMDDVDGICGTHGSGDVEADEEEGEVERGLVACLCQQLDELHFGFPTPPVFVLLTTSRLHSVSPALLRHGRVDLEVHLPALDRPSRLAVLRQYSRRMRFQCSAVEADAGSGETDALLARVNERLHGYVGADVEKVCREVSIRAIQRSVQAGKAAKVTEADFDAVVQHMRPANLSDLEYRLPSEVAPTLDATSPFAALFGVEDVVARLHAAVIAPLLRASLSSASASPLSMPAGLLLYGFPGVGKTSLALAVALSTSLSPLVVQSTSLVSSVLGQTEKNLRALFLKARASSPAVLLIDQIETIASARSASSGAPHTRLLSALLQEMDGVARSVRSRVFIIATSSQPHTIDPALLRPGRIDCHVRVPPPAVEARAAIVRGRMRGMCVVGLDDEGKREALVAELARMSGGCSGADLIGMMREAGLLALRGRARGGLLDDVDGVRAADFLEAARAMRPSLKGVVEHFPPGHVDVRDA